MTATGILPASAVGHGGKSRAGWHRAKPARLAPSLPKRPASAIDGPPQGDETVRLIRQAGGEATFVRTDVRVDAEVRDLIDQTVSTYGRLDCAIFQLPRC